MKTVKENKKRRRLKGVVVSDKMQKTVVVEISRRKLHPIYRKQYWYSVRLKAHDETNAYNTGQAVVIEEVRPLSKDKRWKVVKKN